MQPEEPEHSSIPNASSEPLAPRSSATPAEITSTHSAEPQVSTSSAGSTPAKEPAASSLIAAEESPNGLPASANAPSADTSESPQLPASGGPTIIAPTVGNSTTDTSRDTSGQTPDLNTTPTAGNEPQNATPTVSAPPKKRWLMPTLVALIVLIALGGGYVFALYLPNQPGAVFSRSLKNTADGYDDLVSYEQAQANQHYKGSATNGTLKVSGQDFSADGDFSFNTSGNTVAGTANLDLAGEKLSANIRGLVTSGQTLPDTYVQLNGVKPMLDALGMSKYDNLDGQWIAIDHTLLQSLSNNTKMNPVSAPTAAQIQDALAKAGTVNRNYLLSTKSDKAILTNKKYLGKSKQDGRDVYGYTVGYSKAHLKAYVTALGQALDSSSLNAWVKQASGKSISAMLQPSRVDSLDGNYTFTMYVDAKTKLPHAVRFPDASVTSNYLQLGLNYTGGKSYPFTLRLQTSSGDAPVLLTATATLDTATNKLNVAASLDISSSSPLKMDATFTTVPSNQPVHVTAPSGAVPITQVLAQLGLTPTGLSSSSSMPDTSSLFSL